MLADFPMKFNDDTIPEPISWEEISNVIETVNTTEAGTDKIAVTRYDKLSIYASFQCTHIWVKHFKEYSLMNEFTLAKYDYKTEDYKTHTVRLRELRISVVKDSWHTDITHGLYEVSFRLEEF